MKECVFTDLINGETYYVRTYVVNPDGMMQSMLDGQVVSAVPSPFATEPKNYELINTYTSSATFTAPEDGYYQIELFGRSGSGGLSAVHMCVQETSLSEEAYRFGAAAGGGGGGGGAYCCSNKIKLHKGDKVDIVIDTTCTVTIHSSTDETYNVMKCTPGKNGGDGVVTLISSSSTQASYTATPGASGDGGVASGGNHSNVNGNSGSQAITTVRDSMSKNPGSTGQAKGGVEVVTGGTIGGYGSYAAVKTATKWVSGVLVYYIQSYSQYSPGSAKPGFCRVSRGNTNIA